MKLRYYSMYTFATQGYAERHREPFYCRGASTFWVIPRRCGYWTFSGNRYVETHRREGER